MNLELAKNIRGWMEDDELTWLARRAANARTIIEIGCAYGRTTRALADNQPSGAILYAVDTWAGSPDELASNHRDFQERNGDLAFLEFCGNLWPALTGKVIPLRMHSSNASELLALKGIRADFIFIDGDHSYKAVARDIEKFLPLLAPGGVFAGHDYDENWPGVIKAVNELLPGVTTPANRIWLAGFQV